MGEPVSWPPSRKAAKEKQGDLSTVREAGLGLLEGFARCTAVRRAGPVEPDEWAVEGRGVTAARSTGVNHFVAAAVGGKDKWRKDQNQLPSFWWVEKPPNERTQW